MVHFDGHGVYRRDHGLGALCFEHPAASGKLDRRRSELIDADKLAETIRDHRVPLFFLDACQTAQATLDPAASVAARLLQNGVASVVAMSHSVLVETARRFVTAFYPALLSGRRVGQAMLAGQRALQSDPSRGRIFTEELCLQDWFVPVLFQEENDPQLIVETPAEQVQAQTAKTRRRDLGRLPDPPPHTFVGRSREMLRAERLFENGRNSYVVLRGDGGEGKTTLAAELARWLVVARRFARAAFTSLEHIDNVRALLYDLGEQLVPNFGPQAGGNDDRARQLVERVLEDEPVVIILDNFESVLEADLDDDVLKLASGLARIGRTQLVFTSREPLPPPFDAAENAVRIGRLDPKDAKDLVAKVLHRDTGEGEQDIEDLVEAVKGHARSLVLLAPELAKSGLRAASEIHRIMALLHDRYPDDRERSLFASVELSLRRLPSETRQKIRPLGVFHGGGSLWPMAQVLGGLEVEAVVARQLQDVGLAELVPPAYVQFDPALAPALLRELNEEEQQASRTAWAEAMAGLAGFLDQHKHKDPHTARRLIALDLPNLLGALEHLSRNAAPERVGDMATAIEPLLSDLGRTKTVARVAEARDRAARQLGEWGHARFLAESATIDRLLDADRYPEAVSAARVLLARAEAAGEQAYAGAVHDLAMSHFNLGRALRKSGAAGSALEPLRETRRRFGQERMAVSSPIACGLSDG